MPTRIEVVGLKQAMQNMRNLSDAATKEVNRAAMREMGWRLARPMRDATYTTFKRETGGIRKGLSVQVKQNPDDLTLNAWVVEYKMAVRSALTAFAGKIRRRKRAAGKEVPRDATAFYWRFLEFGTDARRASATPKFLRTGRISKRANVLTRQAAAAAEWGKSASRGGIRSRSWIRPVFASNAADAIDAYREKLLTLIDAAVGKMPKR
jgi:HK97 gp10 family phage protein